MTSRAAAAPSPRELAAWLDVAWVRTATGGFRWDSTGDAIWSFSGLPPALVAVPSGAEVRFWHASGDRWRLAVGDELLAVSDGRSAAAWAPSGVRTGPRLLMPNGPAALLQPEPARPAYATGGHVARDDALGRPAWRWSTGTSVLWVDELTGCLLRRQDRSGVLAFTALELDQPLDDALFAVPDVPPEDVDHWLRPAPPPPVSTASDPRPPTADFGVPWWPDGTLSWPVRGDPSVPEVLLRLVIDQADLEMHLAVAPQGHPARTVPRCRVRRWDGDGWSFALSWRGDLSDDEVERVVASVPAVWA